MKSQIATKESIYTVTLPPFTIQTGTEGSSGPREGVVITLGTQTRETSQRGTKPL